MEIKINPDKSRIFNDLVEYSGLHKELVLRRCQYAATELAILWNKKKNVIDYYKEAEIYIYDLTKYQMILEHYQIIKKMIGQIKDLKLNKILEFGGGFGNITNYLKFKSYFGIDISEVIINKNESKENIKFSCISAQSYYQRMKLDYEKTISNIDYFLDNNKKIKEIKFSIVNKDVSPEEINKFKEKWGKQVFVPKYVNFAGLNFNVSPNNNPCSRALREMCILWNGEVSLCCMDMEGRVIHGDASKNHLIDIWNNESMRRLREFHLGNRRKEYPLCNNCNEN
ncbi:MAG: SPASM domain-containing protein [Nanoarchaeota archaeon]|nr:SPASM domain-containing protein [Nanoarchaeota archaeon]